MKVLVVEDEALLAIALAQSLTSHGFQVLGPVATCTKALSLIATEKFDAAVLDFNLLDGTSEPVALELAKRNIPFVSVTAVLQNELPTPFTGAPCLAKPIGMELLIKALANLASQAP